MLLIAAISSIYELPAPDTIVKQSFSLSISSLVISLLGHFYSDSPIGQTASLCTRYLPYGIPLFCALIVCLTSTKKIINSGKLRLSTIVIGFIVSTFGRCFPLFSGDTITTQKAIGVGECIVSFYLLNKRSYFIFILYFILILVIMA